jgi:hypothetical protein
MDRTFVYPGAIPQDTDILQPQRNVMEAIGFALQAALGVTTTQTLVDGLACTQSPTPNMSVVIAPGSITQSSVVDANAYGSLAADTTDALLKMGINLTSTTLGPFTAPSTAGQSQNFLIQAALSETDVNPTVLPYYNASNPSAPYSGPNNAATAQNTARIERVNLQIVAGTAATTGSQTTPAPSTGYVGLWVITIANGQTSITTSNITAYPGAPFIPAKLGIGMLPGFSNEQVWRTAGTYTFTVPNGVTKVWAQVWGGGAGAGGASSTTSTGGTGGGAGGFTSGIFGVTPGQQIPLTVGAGGTPGAAAGGTGGNGGTSSFGALCSATGGTGGAGNANSGGSGGTGTGGDLNLPGGNASFSVPVASGYYMSGMGGSAWMSPATTPNTAGLGNTAVFPGCGGNGATGDAAGGAGAPGMVIVRW